MLHKQRNATINYRLKLEEDSFIERLVSSGTYKNRSEVVRRALEEFMAKYTGIPTLSSLDDQVKRLRFRCDGYDEDMRIIRRQIKELEDKQREGVS